MLDEATSAVDMATDDQVQRVLREHLPQQTFLTIAHRLNTVIDHKLLVMDAGEVVEFGSASELLQDEGGFFFAMVQALGAPAAALLRSKGGAAAQWQGRA